MQDGIVIRLDSKLLDGREREYGNVTLSRDEKLQLSDLDLWLKKSALCGVYLYEGKVVFEIIGTRTLPLPKKCMDVATLCEWVKNHIKKELAKEGYDAPLELTKESCNARLKRIENYELNKATH